MKLFRLAGSWLNSLGARIAILVILALVVAQAVSILVLTQSSERDRSEIVSESFLRQVAGIAALFNTTPGIDRPGYLQSVDVPGLRFWVADRPAVRADVQPTSDWPTIPSQWQQVESPDKRLEWHPDTRPLTMKYTIAPLPLMRTLTAPPDGNPGNGPKAPGPPPGEGAQIGGLSPSPVVPRPGLVHLPVRWRVAVLLRDGQWLNAEHIYEAGLAPWLRTVLEENAILFLLMICFVVPAIFLATKRLSLLSSAADRLGRGDDLEPLHETGSSEIRRLTTAFNNMSLRLRRFVQGRTQMLAGISHDLRTPITALRLRADLVDDDENRQRMLALIDDMHHLTEGTLALAKDESFTEKSDILDVSSLIEGICDDLTDAGIDASADIERGVRLTCRPHSLRRAIRNLAENGAKYGKRSRIHMNGDARNVRIMIDDDGPGIPEDQIEKAFLPFVRLEGSRDRKTGGSGLGLAITRSIVLNHGGEIVLANRAQGGLRATITLPRGDGE